MITWITDHLAIGEYVDIIEFDLQPELIKNPPIITAIVNLRIKNSKTEMKVVEKTDVFYAWCPIKTLPEMNKRKFIKECNKAIETVLERLSLGEKVLVHCTGGIDRAPFIVAKILVSYYKVESLSKAYSMIKEKRPWIAEHYEWDW